MVHHCPVFCLAPFFFMSLAQAILGKELEWIMTNYQKHFMTYSDEFLEVIGEDPQFYTVVETSAHEGPVFVESEQALYFTTTPVSSDVPIAGSKQTSIARVGLKGDLHFPLDPSVVEIVSENTNLANGMTQGPNDQLIICEQGTKTTHARISSMSLATRSTECVVDQWRGLRFNSPNDVVVKSDGTIWFTDPSYGYLQDIKNAPMVGDYVYRYDPKHRQVSVVADSLNKPNGLAFSPDEAILYINDSAAIQSPGSYHVDLPHHIKAFDINNGRQLVNERLFAVVSPGIPDGLKVDTKGRVYSSSASGVQVFNKEGDLIGEILAPGAANFTFGGSQKNVLYLLADDIIWAAQITAQGV